MNSQSLDQSQTRGNTYNEQRSNLSEIYYILNLKRERKRGPSHIAIGFYIKYKLMIRVVFFF